MKKLLFILLLPVFLLSQDRTYSDANYVAIDSIVGTTISNTAFAFAADRLHFASWIVVSDSYSITKIRLFSQRAAGSPAMKYTATIYDNNDGSTLPSTILGTSADSIAYDGQTGAYYNFDFRFNPAISVSAGDTIWYGPSTYAYSGTNYWNVGRYTDAALEGKTLKDDDQVSWAAYLTDPLGVVIYETQVVEDTGDKGFKETPKYKKFPGWR